MHAFRAAINPGCQVSEYIARMSAEKGGGGEEVAELLMSEMAIVGDDQLKDKKAFQRQHPQSLDARSKDELAIKGLHIFTEQHGENTRTKILELLRAESSDVRLKVLDVLAASCNLELLWSVGFKVNLFKDAKVWGFLSSAPHICEISFLCISEDHRLGWGDGRKVDTIFHYKLHSFDNAFGWTCYRLP